MDEFINTQNTHVAQSIIDQINDLCSAGHSGSLNIAQDYGELDDTRLARLRETITNEIWYILHSEIEKWHGGRRSVVRSSESLGYIPTHRIRRYLVDGTKLVAEGQRVEIRPYLLRRLELAYPQTWVDRAQALIEHGPVSGCIDERMGALTALMVYQVTHPIEFDHTFAPKKRHRDDRSLLDDVAKLLSDKRDSHDKRIQARVVAKIQWLTTYLLDCLAESTGSTFRRSLRQIVDDSKGLMKDPKRTSAILAMITAGHEKCLLPIFEVQVADPGWPGSPASTFSLSPGYEYLLHRDRSPRTSLLA